MKNVIYKKYLSNNLTELASDWLSDDSLSIGVSDQGEKSTLSFTFKDLIYNIIILRDGKYTTYTSTKVITIFKPFDLYITSWENFKKILKENPELTNVVTNIAQTTLKTHISTDSEIQKKKALNNYDWTWNKNDHKLIDISNDLFTNDYKLKSTAPEEIKNFITFYQGYPRVFLGTSSRSNKVKFDASKRPIDGRKTQRKTLSLNPIIDPEALITGSWKGQLGNARWPESLDQGYLRNRSALGLEVAKLPDPSSSSYDTAVNDYKNQIRLSSAWKFNRKSAIKYWDNWIEKCIKDNMRGRGYLEHYEYSPNHEPLLNNIQVDVNLSILFDIVFPSTLTKMPGVDGLNNFYRAVQLPYYIHVKIEEQTQDTLSEIPYYASARIISNNEDMTKINFIFPIPCSDNITTPLKCKVLSEDRNTINFEWDSYAIDFMPEKKRGLLTYHCDLSLGNTSFNSLLRKNKKLYVSWGQKEWCMQWMDKKAGKEHWENIETVPSQWTCSITQQTNGEIDIKTSKPYPHRLQYWFTQSIEDTQTNIILNPNVQSYHLADTSYAGSMVFVANMQGKILSSFLLRQLTESEVTISLPPISGGQTKITIHPTGIKNMYIRFKCFWEDDDNDDSIIYTATSESSSVVLRDGYAPTHIWIKVLDSGLKVYDKQY